MSDRNRFRHFDVVSGPEELIRKHCVYMGCEFPEEPLEDGIAPQELLSSILSEFPCETHRYQKVNSGVTILQNPGE